MGGKEGIEEQDRRLEDSEKEEIRGRMRGDEGEGDRK